MNAPHSDLGPAGRPLAALLAGLWIAAGAAASVLGLLRGRWLPLILGPLGIAYGLLWLRVAITGRRLRWRRRG